MNWRIITSYPDADLEKKWLDFLPASSYPSHYTSPGYFKESFREDQNPFAVLVIDEEKVLAAATGLRLGKQIFSGLAVRPQVSVSETFAQQEIVEVLRGGFLELAENNAELITLYCADQLPGLSRAGFSEKKSTGSDEFLVLDLTGGADTVFKGFSQSRRSDLRKAMRENRLQISQLETIEELAQLYEIHLDWSRRKGLEPESWEAMQVFLSEPDYHRIFLARHAGKIVAGSYFRFCRNGLFEYSANNSIPEYRHLRPNDLLVWRALEWACTEGFTRCSLGASHLFLRRFGGELVASYRYQLDRTFLKKHEKKQAIKDLTLKTYQAIPFSARQKLKKIIGRS